MPRDKRLAREHSLDPAANERRIDRNDSIEYPGVVVEVRRPGIGREVQRLGGLDIVTVVVEAGYAAAREALPAWIAAQPDLTPAAAARAP